MRFKFFLFITLFISVFFACFSKKKNISVSPLLPIIGVTSHLNSESSYIKEIHDNIRKNAEGRANVIFENSEHDTTVQNASIDTFLEENVDALIVLLARNNRADSIMRKVQEKDIPVIFIVRDPGPEIIDYWDNAYFTGSSPTESGRMSTEILLSYFRDHPESDLNGDRIIQYVVLMGSKANKIATFRTKAYEDTFAYHGERGNYFGEVLAKEFAYWDHETAYEKTLMFLEKFPNKIEAVLANSDAMALGALQALQENGYNKIGSLHDLRHRSAYKKTDEKFIPIVGVNGYVDAINFIAQGKILGTVFESTFSHTLDAVNIAISLTHGHPPDSELSGPLTDYTGKFYGNYAWASHQKITVVNCKNFLQRILGNK